MSVVNAKTTKQYYHVELNFDSVESSDGLENAQLLDGTLSPSMRFAEVGAAYSAANHKWDVLRVTDSGVEIELPSGTQTILPTFGGCEDAAFCYDGETEHLFATSEKNGVYRYDGDDSEQLFDLRLYGMTICGYRLCGFNGKTVYFSDINKSSFDADDGGGSIPFEKVISGICAVGGKLWVFAGDLFCVHFDCDVAELSVEKTACGVDNVTEKPLALSSRIYYVGRSGLYSVKGKEIKKIFSDERFRDVTHGMLVQSADCVALYVLREKDLTGSIYGFDYIDGKILFCVKQSARQLFDSFGQLYCVYLNKLYAANSLPNSADQSVWTSNPILLDVTQQRFINSVGFTLDGKATLAIKTDKNLAEITLERDGTFYAMPIYVYGNLLTCKITLHGNSSIRDVVLGGYYYSKEVNL